jgi:hypothetical protein
MTRYAVPVHCGARDEGRLALQAKRNAAGGAASPRSAARFLLREDEIAGGELIDTAIGGSPETVESNWLAVSDPERAKKVLARELKITDPKVLQASYDDFQTETPPDAGVDIQRAKNVSMSSPVHKSHNVEDYVDTGIMNGLKKSGFFDEMKKKYAAPR